MVIQYQSSGRTDAEQARIAQQQAAQGASTPSSTPSLAPISPRPIQASASQAVTSTAVASRTAPPDVAESRSALSRAYAAQAEAEISRINRERIDTLINGLSEDTKRTFIPGYWATRPEARTMSNLERAANSALDVLTVLPFAKGLRGPAATIFGRAARGIAEGRESTAALRQARATLSAATAARTNPAEASRITLASRALESGIQGGDIEVVRGAARELQSAARAAGLRSIEGRAIHIENNADRIVAAQSNASAFRRQRGVLAIERPRTLRPVADRPYVDLRSVQALQIGQEASRKSAVDEALRILNASAVERRSSVPVFYERDAAAIIDAEGYGARQFEALLSNEPARAAFREQVASQLVQSGAAPVRVSVLALPRPGALPVEASNLRLGQVELDISNDDLDRLPLTEVERQAIVKARSSPAVDAVSRERISARGEIEQQSRFDPESSRGTDPAGAPRSETGTQPAPAPITRTTPRPRPGGGPERTPRLPKRIIRTTPPPRRLRGGGVEITLPESPDPASPFPAQVAYRLGGSEHRIRASGPVEYGRDLSPAVPNDPKLAPWETAVVERYGKRKLEKRYRQGFEQVELRGRKLSFKKARI